VLECLGHTKCGIKVLDACGDYQKGFYKMGTRRKYEHFTQQEAIFVERYAEVGQQHQASLISGIHPRYGKKVAKRAHVQAEIARVQTARLFNEILPLAINVHIDVLKNPATPASARVQAVKLAYDRTLGDPSQTGAKEAFEMSAEELSRAIDDARIRAAALESIAADRAKPVIDVTSEPPVAASIFD
jgi:hypothetical protein